MKRKLMILVFCFSIAMNMAFLASIGSQRTEHKNEEVVSHENKALTPVCLYEELALSDSQIVQMKQLRYLLDTDMTDMKQGLQQKRFELVTLLTEPELNSEEITNVSGEIGSLQGDLQEIIIDNLIEQKKILTPEQQEKFFSAISTRICPERKRCRRRQQEKGLPDGGKGKGRRRQGRSNGHNRTD